VGAISTLVVDFCSSYDNSKVKDRLHKAASSHKAPSLLDPGLSLDTLGNGCTLKIDEHGSFIENQYYGG